MGENVKLAPCPFCGGDAKTMTYRTSEDSMGCHVYCTSCDARTTEFEDAYAPTADAVEAWNRRAGIPEDTASDDVLGYVLRYGGMCRDCADMDGVCQSGQPCDTEQRRAVIKHTIAALAYGIKHGFIANPFQSPLAATRSDSATTAKGNHDAS